MDLRQPGEFTEYLFAEVQPATAARVMGVLDQINGRWGERDFAASECAGRAWVGDEAGNEKPLLHYQHKGAVQRKINRRIAGSCSPEL